MASDANEGRSRTPYLYIADKEGKMIKANASILDVSIAEAEGNNNFEKKVNELAKGEGVCRISILYNSKEAKKIQVGVHSGNTASWAVVTGFKIEELDADDIRAMYKFWQTPEAGQETSGRGYNALHHKDFNSIMGQRRTKLQQMYELDITKVADADVYAKYEEMKKAYTDFRHYRGDMVEKYFTCVDKINPSKETAKLNANRTVEETDDIWHSYDKDGNNTDAKVNYFFSGEHWSGDNTRTYMNQWDGDNWNDGYFNTEGFDFNVQYTTVPLPKGTYIFKAATRRSKDMESELTASIVEPFNGEWDKKAYKRPVVKEIAELIEFPITFRDDKKQTDGYGIDTNGDPVYFAEDGNFVHDDRGRGWAYAYMIFTITDEDYNLYVSNETNYEVGIPESQSAEGDGTGTTNTMKLSNPGVRIRISLNAKAETGEQYISLGDCEIWRVNDKEITDENDNAYHHYDADKYNAFHTALTDLNSDDVTERTLTRKTSTNWGTICLPYTVLKPSNADVYKILGKSDNTVYCKHADVLEAGVAYIYHVSDEKAEANTEVKFQEVGYFTGAARPFPAQNGLKGWYDDKEGDWTMANKITDFEDFEKYIFTENSLVMKDGVWYRVAYPAKYHFNKYRAFIINENVVPAVSEEEVRNERGVMMMAIGGGLNDGTTGIDGIIDADAKADNTCYNLAGQRVRGNAKGIVIMNGKKIVR